MDSLGYVARRALLIAFSMSVLTLLGPAAALAAPGFTTSYYGNPGVVGDTNGSTITVLTPPAGVYYTAQLDPTHTYHVTFTGHALSGDWILRLQRDGKTPLAYRDAPAGTQSFEVDGVSTFQMLLYTNSPGGGQYRLDGLKIVDC